MMVTKERVETLLQSEVLTEQEREQVRIALPAMNSNLICKTIRKLERIIEDRQDGLMRAY